MGRKTIVVCDECDKETPLNGEVPETMPVHSLNVCVGRQPIDLCHGCHEKVVAALPKLGGRELNRAPP